MVNPNQQASYGVMQGAAFSALQVNSGCGVVKEG